jgi:hypothetical protein
MQLLEGKRRERDDELTGKMTPACCGRPVVVLRIEFDSRQEGG